MAQVPRQRIGSRFVNKNFPPSVDSRATSPTNHEAYTTVTGFSLDNVLHSTPQQQDFSVPLQYDQHAELSEHSSDMSIELGRGMKGGLQQDQDNDRSSNALFTFRNEDSMYDISGGLLSRQRPAQRRFEGPLRKDATIRRATETARANDGLRRSVSNPKQRAVSDNSAPAPTSAKEPTQPKKASRSRFGAPHVSTRANIIPVRYSPAAGLEFNNGTATGNLTTQTTQTVTYTNNQSFLLPDMPGIAELIAGVRTDATPVAKRVSRSRFASTGYKPQPREHLPVQGITVPEDERAIYASLQLLRDRINQLEMENSEVQKRSEDYENELIELRSRLELASKRPDGDLATEDARNTQQHSKLQAEVKVLQERLNRSERKTNVSEEAMSRVTKERDALVTHVGSAYSRSEQLIEENEVLRANEGQLETENARLREEVYVLSEANIAYRNQLDRLERAASQNKKSTAPGERASEPKDGPWNFTANSRMVENSIRSKKEGKTASLAQEQSHRRRASEHADHALVLEITERIEREIQKIKEDTIAGSREPSRTHDQQQRSRSARSRSRSQRRQASANEYNTTATSKRIVSAPAEMEISGGESTTELDVNRQAPSSKTASKAAQAVEDDLTILSELDFNLAANLRRKLEQELRDGHFSRGNSSKANIDNDTTKVSTRRLSVPRKSSMKDIPSAADNNDNNNTATARTLEELLKTSKTVRVQSPHSSDIQFQSEQHQPDETEDVGDTSMLSNTSRRRRRSASATSEGLTSAFIIPDITLRNSLATTGSSTIPHAPATCTGCTGHPPIPTPSPVSGRKDLEDLTNMTVRPSKAPDLALAEVIKTLEDEVTHLKLVRERVNQKYNSHDPALGKRRRGELKAELDRLTALLEKRCDVVYGLYDVLEGQRRQHDEGQEVDDGEKWGEEVSGRTTRNPVEGLPDLESEDGEEEMSEELPWEGLSELSESEDGSVSEVGQRRRSGGF
jgi:hypothetical protein